MPGAHNTRHGLSPLKLRPVDAHNPGARKFPGT
ncbi:hypothetical protein [Achromobacter phage SE2]|nr:hypothetical protein [Achromobacter phage SE2]